jgi:hypothetical protein
MHTWFRLRSASPTSTTHLDAQSLVDRFGGVDALDRMYDSLVELVRSRPSTRTIAARSGDPETMLLRLEHALTDVPG